MSNKIISLLLSMVLFITAAFSCYAEGEAVQEPQMDFFVQQELFRQYSLIYDTFSAAVILENGEEITGFAFTDYSKYFEADDGSIGYFSAGFIADYGYEIPQINTDEILVIENLDFTDEKYQFIYDCETVPFMEHCVKGGQYLKYGVNDHGAIAFETRPYERGVCDESLGALYSYDTGKFLFDPDMGNYVHISGKSLYDLIDFNEVTVRINQILSDQNSRLSEQDIISSVHIAQEAVLSYLLSMQQETFLGQNVAELTEYAAKLDPMECVRITPDGLVVIEISDEMPEGAAEVTKWLVGIGCGMAVAASTALTIFVPAMRPLSGAITGAAVEVFMQVVINSKNPQSIKWEKVAVAAVSGATMAWLCPMAASGVTEIVTKAGGKALGKLAGYGVLTLSNGLTSGLTGYANATIDGGDKWQAFKSGLIIGAVSTAAASALAEAMPAFGPRVEKLISRTKIGAKVEKALRGVNQMVGEADLRIRDHQVHLPEKLENILAPKSVHQAAERAWREINNQVGPLGGKFSEMTNPGDCTKHKHETPSYSAYNEAMGIKDPQRGELPAIKMDASDHRRTASFGSSQEAISYRQRQIELISKGDMHGAIQMDIDDLTSKFGTKYNDGIEQMKKYAITKGWW